MTTRCALGGIKPRALLAVLILHANEPVSAEQLALALWGEDAPASTRKRVQGHVSRLRKAFSDPDLIVTSRAGYRLRVREGELDAERFETLVAEGRQALAAGEADQAGAVLREALGLWRGAPLADLADEPFAADEIARLEEQRRSAIELQVDADVAAEGAPGPAPAPGRRRWPAVAAAVVLLAVVVTVVVLTLGERRRRAGVGARPGRLGRRDRSGHQHGDARAPRRRGAGSDHRRRRPALGAQPRERDGVADRPAP